jgi:hypothetical protein
MSTVRDPLDRYATAVVDKMKSEGFLPAVTAAPAADSLRPEVTKVAADVDKLTGEVDELKQLVTRMGTKLDEYREHMSTNFEDQRKLVRKSFYIVVGIIVGIQTYWMMQSHVHKSVHIPTNTRIWCEYVHKHRGDGLIMYDGVEYLWNQTTMYLHNMTRK